jgi:hypothetical protein
MVHSQLVLYFEVDHLYRLQIKLGQACTLEGPHELRYNCYIEFLVCPPQVVLKLFLGSSDKHIRLHIEIIL